MTNTAAPYFPSAAQWERCAPQAAGMSAAALDAAMRFADASECDWPRSLFLPDGRYIGTAYVDDRPPYDSVLGEVRPRGGVNGLVVRGGRIVAEWGDTLRADTTFSAAKSYLALLACIALDDGLIRSIDDPVAAYRNERDRDDGFDSPHNRAITWRHLLNQTSEWQGSLWDRPDSVDHHRQAGVAHDNRGKGVQRALQAPGTNWEYNDVRVNRLSLSLLQLFRRPLPEVLRERIMAPIGASDSWQWLGYRNSAVDIDGRPIVSVSGGGHWGGGLFIASRDHVRVGYLVHRGGVWNGRRLLSEQSVALLKTPCAANPSYGALWWLNTDRALFPSASADSVFAIGGGQHLIWLDPGHDLVMVVRWVERTRCDELLARMLASILPTHGGETT